MMCLAMTWPLGPQNGSNGNGAGRLKVILAVWLSGLSIRAMSLYAPEVTAVEAGSATHSQVATTSSAVNGFPSCHVTFFLSFQVTDSPSFEIPPFWRVGTSAARTGSRLPSGSNEHRGSWKIREASVSFVPGDRWGFRMTGACHHKVLTGPPPPRFVGVKAGLVCACATPAD